MKELIEQIGGRERLEAIVYAMGAEPCDADPILDSVTHGDIGKMARALLAVLDAQSKPAAWIINCNSARINFAETEKNSVDKIIEECRESGTEIDITPLYTTPPAPSVPDGGRNEQ